MEFYTFDREKCMLPGRQAVAQASAPSAPLQPLLYRISLVTTQPEVSSQSKSLNVPIGLETFIPLSCRASFTSLEARARMTTMT